MCKKKSMSWDVKTYSSCVGYGFKCVKNAKFYNYFDDDDHHHHHHDNDNGVKT